MITFLHSAYPGCLLTITQTTLELSLSDSHKLVIEFDPVHETLDEALERLYLEYRGQPW